MTDSARQLAIDMTRFYCDMDPYGARDAMEDNETEEQFSERSADTIADLEDLRDTLDGWTSWGWASDPDTAGPIAAFKTRLKNLEAVA